MDREPCPWRVVDDAGGAFIFGISLGTIYNFFGGLRNAPKGQRLVHAVTRIKARVPILGGGFAVWGVAFSCFDCTIAHIRKKEDTWNAIVSGAAAGGLLAARAGLKAAGRNALMGGVILAAIEGLNVVVSRVVMPMMEKKQLEAGMPVDLLDPPVDPLRPYVKSTPLWTPAQEERQSLSYLPPVMPSPGTGGIDIDTASHFDPNAQDDWEKRRQMDAEEAASKTEQKPAWKIW